MFYRLRVGTIDGIERGYQWREIDQTLFSDIVTGQRPLADSEAQNRDSTQVRADAENRVMHYLGVWDPVANAWTSDIQTQDVATLYTQYGYERIGA